MKKADDLKTDLGTSSYGAPICFDVPLVAFHVTMTLIPFEEDKREKTVHHLVMGVENEGEAIASVQQRYYMEGIRNGAERWTAERSIRMNRPDKDKTIVFKL